MNTMNIERHIATIRRIRTECEYFNPGAASEEAIAEVSARFEREIGHRLPEAYLNLLRITNGIAGDGLIIWPAERIEPEEEFKESIVEANLSFRSIVSDDFIYLGQRDDSVFVMDTLSGRFMALEICGLAEWEDFENCGEMIEFMLEQAAWMDEENAETGCASA